MIFDIGSALPETKTKLRHINGKLSVSIKIIITILAELNAIAPLISNFYMAAYAMVRKNALFHKLGNAC